MSTPFPLEEAAQADTGQPVWNPWKSPAEPHWYNGMGFTEDTAYLGPAYRALASVGSAAAKGELVLGGAMHQGSDVDPESKIAGAGLLSAEDSARAKRQAAALDAASVAVQADARERIKALRPDPATSGLAVQVLHGLGEGLSTVAMTGPAGVPGIFTGLATTQGYSAYQDLLEQGVQPKTAAEVASVRGILAGAGGVTPMAFGATLLPRVATSMASNVGFGVVGRGVDSHILRSAGYDEMADQEQVFDRTQLFVDLALGAGFGAWAHIHESMIDAAKLSHAMQGDSQLRDAALVANLALKDRRSGPGIPVDPMSANLHTGALEKATQDLQNGEAVNVAPTGIEHAEVLSRGGEDNPKVADLLIEHLKDSGLLEEHGKLEALEAALGERLAGTTEAQHAEAPEATEHPTNAVTALRPGPGEVQHEVDSENSRMHTVVSENGHTTAYQRGEQLQIADSRTAEAAQGKGEGMARMYKLLDVARERGLTLTSDTKVSGAAQKQYARLEREGYEVTRNPAEPDPEGNDNLIATAGRPIFEVKPTEPLPQRLAKDQDLREGLTALKSETGWAQQGGRVLMDETGKVTGRTSWIPREQWWADRPKGLTEVQVQGAVDKALAGKALSKRQTDIVKFMTEVHDERVQRAGVRAELAEAVPDLNKQPEAAIDLTVLSSRAASIDAKATMAVIDSWTDDTPATLTRLQNEFEAIIGRGHEGKDKFELAASPAGREEPASAPKAAGQKRLRDLFGEDRTAEQQLHDELRRRDLARSPTRDVTLETGRPDDLFSHAQHQTDLTDAHSPFAVDLATKGGSREAKPAAGETKGEEPATAAAARLADQAIAERPGLSITRDDGSTVPALYAKEQVDSEVAQTEKAAPTLFQSIADCVLRNGS